MGVSNDIETSMSFFCFVMLSSSRSELHASSISSSTAAGADMVERITKLLSVSDLHRDGKGPQTIYFRIPGRLQFCGCTLSQATDSGSGKHSLAQRV